MLRTPRSKWWRVEVYEPLRNELMRRNSTLSRSHVSHTRSQNDSVANMVLAVPKPRQAPHNGLFEYNP